MSQKFADRSNIKTMLVAVRGWIRTAVDGLKDTLLDASGKLKASLLPLGAGLKEVDGKVAFDSANVEIDASKVNIATASKTVKGLVQVGGGLSVTAAGVVSADLTEARVNTLAEAKAKAAVNALVNGAPAAMDTLKELADAITDHQDVTDALNAAIGNKASKATTLSGYGITDAKIANGTITLGPNSITPLTTADVEPFTVAEIQEILTEVLAEEAA